jgi:hypothetical protein
VCVQLTHERSTNKIAPNTQSTLKEASRGIKDKAIEFLHAAGSCPALACAV